MKKFFLSLLIPVQLLAQNDLIIRHINIVDVVTGNIKNNQIVLIQNRKIVAIRNDDKKIVNNAGEQVNGANKYLIPGLWDMHSHGRWDFKITKEYKIPMLLANGITGLRNMWGQREEVLLRDSINRNEIVAPRMIVGSPLVNGPGSFMDRTISISTVDRVPIVVDSLRNVGYDFIKVYSFLRHDIFFALANYCKEKNIPIAGHVPIGVTAEQASEAGMQSIEHMTGLRRSFSGESELISRKWEKEIEDTSGYRPYLNIFLKSESPSIPVDTLKAKKVIATLIMNHTSIVPTLVVFPAITFNRDTLMKTTSMTYIPKSKQQEWYNQRDGTSNEAGIAENSVRLLGFLHKQGVMIMSGTDNEVPFLINGFSLHDELEWYVKAGLTPLEALQTATLNPAIFLHKEKELGSVTTGKFADLVILEKNPLTDIKNTRQINAVIMNGVLINKMQITQLLKEVEKRAAK